MRVLIAGCGFVGSRLAADLSARGDQVWGLRRNVAELPAGVRPLEVDLATGAGLAGVPDALDATVYLVAAGARNEAAYRRAYVDGLDRLLAQQGRDAGPGRLVFASSTAVYAQQDGSLVDESSPTEPTHFSGRLLLEGEAMARAAGGFVLRFGGIYGPGRRRLIDRVRSGEARYAPGPPRYTNRIHRDDCAGAISHLLGVQPGDEPDSSGVYVGVDEHPAPEREVYEWLAQRLGVPAPEPALAAPEAPPSPAGRREASNKRCSSRKLRASGYAFRHPSYREGYAAMLAQPGDA